MTAWTGIREEPIAVAVGAAVVAAALGLYVATAARDIVLGDTPELTAVALTFGVAHPPGYPVFTMLGWLFGQLPVGPLPFRIALLSVVCHAATVGIVYAATLRFTRSVPAAAVAAGALAFEPLFWSWSLVAEVFPLNDLLAATMLFLVALWHEEPERNGYLVAGAVVGGLGMANHQTIALVAPAVFYVMWRRRSVLLRAPARLLRVAGGFGLGLAPYVVLLVAAGRHPFWSWGDLRTPGDLVAHFLRQSYGTAALLVGSQFQGGSPQERVLALLTDMGPVFMVLSIVGAAYALYAGRWYAIYLLTAFVIAGPAFAVYSNARLDQETTRAVLERFFLMPHAVVAPLAGFAVLAARDLAARLRLAPRVVGPAVASAAMIAALAFVPLDYREIDQSGNRVARRFAEDLLASVRPGSFLLAAGDSVVYPIWYLQTIEGFRPDVATVAMSLLSADWYIREVRRLHRDLIVPDDRYAPGAGQIRSLFDANRKRPLAALGELPDSSTQGLYWFYTHGLIYEVKPAADIVTLGDMVADNESVLASYHIPRDPEVSGPYRTWERLTLVDYARGYYAVGHEYEVAAEKFKDVDPKQAATLYDSARDWYRRALEVRPDLAEANEGLDRLAR